MKLDWKKMCYEEVLDYHPDRLADRLADYIGKELDKNLSLTLWDYRWEHPNIHINKIAIKHYSIDIVLARDTVNIYVELSYLKNQPWIEREFKTFIEEKTRKFLYLQDGLDECLKTTIGSLKVNVYLFHQAESLLKKKDNVSNDNCIINYYNSEKLQFIKDTFKAVKKYLNTQKNILRDGKLILAYDEKENYWIVYCVLCFKGDEIEIKKTINEIENAFEPKNSNNFKIKVINKDKENIWNPPCSFMSDIGLTGRKLQSDFFYGLAPHQQGSIHGKDISKYDRYGYEKLKQMFDKEKTGDEIFVSETWLSGKKEPLKTYIYKNNLENK